MANWVQAIPAIVKGGTAIYKGVKQSQQAKELRDEYGDVGYEIPESIQEQLQGARAMAATADVPGEEQLRKELGASTAEMVTQAKRASGPNEFMAAVQAAHGREQSQLGQLQRQKAKSYRRDQRLYQQALQRMARQQGRQQQYLQRDKRMALQSAGNLATAGGQNITEGATLLAGTGSALAGQEQGQTATGPAKQTRSQKKSDTGTINPYSPYGMSDKEKSQFMKFQATKA